MRYLATAQMAVKAVCGIDANFHGGANFHVKVGKYNIYINDTMDWPEDMDILVHDIYSNGFPTKRFTCSVSNIREQLYIAYAGCLMEAF